MGYTSNSRKSTDLTMKGTAGRDCSPRSHQQRGFSPSKAAENIGQTGVGTPMGGVPPEGKGTGQGAGGVLDPGAFNVDLHAVRQFSHYWEGKRSGPDWLHKRIEAAEQARYGLSDAMLSQSLPKRRKL